MNECSAKKEARKTRITILERRIATALAILTDESWLKAGIGSPGKGEVYETKALLAVRALTGRGPMASSGVPDAP